MTLVLALTACDGVVLIADGKATGGAGALKTRTPAEKLGSLHGRIAYGFAGSSGLRQRTVERLERDISPDVCGLDLAELRPQLMAAVNAVQHEAVAEHVLSPIQKLLKPADGGIEALFAGVSDAGVPWIYEVTPEGRDEEHLKAEAIGSGRPYARYALISAEHYGLRDRGLRVVRVVACRAVDAAIRTDASELGEPMSMYVVTSAGAHHLTEEEMQAVRSEVVAWQVAETEIFEKVGVDDEATPSERVTASTTGIDPPADPPEDPGKAG